MARVLLVDDQQRNLMALEVTLEQPGRDLISALSGHAAVAAAERYDFAVAILDVMMPGMDGFQTAVALRKISPGLPIIFMSAASDEEALRQKAAQIGACHVMGKPFDPPVLRREIERHERVA